MSTQENIIGWISEELSLNESAGNYTINCSYGGNDKYVGSTASKAITIIEEVIEESYTPQTNSYSDSYSSQQSSDDSRPSVDSSGITREEADYYGWDNQRPFWLYTLDNNDIRPAYGIDANVPYLICMPNADEYGDQYNLAGNVTFMATNVDIAVSKPKEEAQGDITFVPTYQSVPVSTDVFTLNVNEEYKGYPAGSLFVSNFRTVRPFEAYSVHPTAAAKRVNEARMYTVSSLIGGNTGTTGIIDVMLKKNDGTNSDAVVKVYSLSGALIKQGKAEDVTNGLPKGVYVANGKKFVVK